jgi:Ankyrin repeat.
MKKPILFFAFALACFTMQAQQSLTKEMTVAFKNNDKATVQTMIDDTNKNQCYQTGVNNITPLHLSVIVGASDVLDYLINDAEVNVNERCTQRTALMMAAQTGNLDAVKTLVEAGADKSVIYNNKTAKDLALAAGFPAVAREL